MVAMYMAYGISDTMHSASTAKHGQELYEDWEHGLSVSKEV